MYKVIKNSIKPEKTITISDIDPRKHVVIWVDSEGTPKYKLHRIDNDFAFVDFGDSYTYGISRGSAESMVLKAINFIERSLKCQGESILVFNNANELFEYISKVGYLDIKEKV